MPAPGSSASDWKGGWTWWASCGRNAQRSSVWSVERSSSSARMPFDLRGATMFVPKIDDSVPRRQTALAEIDRVVSERLGRARVAGNAQPAAFNRQVAMYLAKRVGGWSLTKIGKFYNGRHHTTVRHAIRRIEALREVNPDVDGLLAVLIDPIKAKVHTPKPENTSGTVRRAAPRRSARRRSRYTRAPAGPGELADSARRARCGSVRPSGANHSTWRGSSPRRWRSWWKARLPKTLSSDRPPSPRTRTCWRYPCQTSPLPGHSSRSLRSASRSPFRRRRGQPAASLALSAR